MKITIEFCIFELVPNFSFSKQLWRLKEFSQTSILPSKNRKNQHHYWILHIPISFSIKFHFKQTILDFEITFAQNRYFQQKTKKMHSTIQYCLLKLLWLPNFTLKQQFEISGQNLRKTDTWSKTNKVNITTIEFWLLELL